jgi:hypothetical protein
VSFIPLSIFQGERKMTAHWLSSQRSTAPPTESLSIGGEGPGRKSSPSSVNRATTEASPGRAPHLLSPWISCGQQKSPLFQGAWLGTAVLMTCLLCTDIHWVPARSTNSCRCSLLASWDVVSEVSAGVVSPLPQDPLHNSLTHCLLVCLPLDSEVQSI